MSDRALELLGEFDAWRHETGPNPIDINNIHWRRKLSAWADRIAELEAENRKLERLYEREIEWRKLDKREAERSDKYFRAIIADLKAKISGIHDFVRAFDRDCWDEEAELIIEHVLKRTEVKD